MPHPSRRNFLGTAGAGAALAALAPAVKAAARSGKGADGLTLGLASYTFRKFTLGQTLDAVKRLGIAKIALKDFHLPLTASDAELADAAGQCAAAGVDLYGCGVVYMKTPEEVERAYRYAAAAGIRTLIGVPQPELLPLAESRSAATGIRLAIHNHGPEDKTYPTVASVMARIAKLDPRVGLCVDVGHTRRAGEDPAAVIRKHRERVLDVHVKDVSSATPEGTTVEIGRGVVDTASIVRALLDIRYAGVVSFEYEKDENDPLPGLAESAGFVRGVLSVVA